MADRAVAPDRQGRADVGVKHAAVLDVGALAHLDGLIVAPEHGTEPDARVAFEPHSPDHGRGGRDPILAFGRKIRSYPVENVGRHRGRLFEIVIENSHREIIRELAVLLVAEDYPDEFLANIDFRRIGLLGPPAHFNLGKLELGAQKPGKLLNFFRLQIATPDWLPKLV